MPTQVRIGWRSGSSSQTAASIVTSGLIMNLDANNVSSYSGTGTTWTDLSGSNNGTLVNGTGYSSVNGGSLVFDGVNDWVENLSSTLLNNLSKFTLNTWFKVNNTSLNNSIFSFNWNNAGANDILLGVYENYLFCQVNNGVDGSAYINGFTSTSWNNVQVVYDGTLSGNSNRLKMYLNGVLLTLQYDSYTVPATTANNASRFALGAYINGNFNNRLFGNIANCLIYNTALSASEITQNFDATKTRFGYSTLDTDAQAFVTAASITDATQQSAVNTLVTSLKSAGIWTKMRALYPFVGGTAASHKFNLKDPRDLDAAYRLVFNGGWVHSSTGAKPNGSNAYADTKLVPSTTLTQYNSHLSYYSRSQTLSSSNIEFGAYVNDNQCMFLTLQRSGGSDNGGAVQYSISADSNMALLFGNTTTTGMYLSNRTSSTATSLKYIRNGVSLANATTTAGSLPSIPLFLGGSNDNGSPLYYSAKESAFASIGDGLTDAEVLVFYNVVQTFQTTLGRHVGVPIVADTDAQAFLNAAIITDSTQASAVNTLVTSLKTAGIWTKMKALYPFVGGTATSHKFNLKDPRDLDAAYRLVFNGGWVHSSTGAKPNGTTGYARTFLIPKTTFGRNISNTGDNAIIHVSKYSRTNQTITSNFWLEGVYSLKTGGGTSGFNPADLVFLNHSFSTQYQGSSSTTIGGVDPNASIYGFSNNTQGYFLFTRTSNNMFRAFRNNNLVGTNTYDVTTSVETPQTEYLLGVRNDSYNNQFNPFGYNPLENSFTSIGDGLTDAEAAAFYNAVQAFQTTLGRQV